MRTVFAAFVSGGIFGAGLLISQMTNPSKVIGFLDFFGNWDPSLAFVMGGALLVTFIGYRLVLPRGAPKFDSKFHLPTSKDIDGRLMGGAALFGIGWGLSGLCPGPALSMSTFGGINILYFLVGMIGTMVAFRILKSGKRLP